MKQQQMWAHILWQAQLAPLYYGPITTVAMQLPCGDDRLEALQKSDSNDPADTPRDKNPGACVRI